MAFFRRALDSLRTDRTPYQPTLLDFPNVDPIKAKRELKAEERGKARGAENLPPTDQAGLDDIEQEIVTAVEGYKQAAGASLTTNLEVYAGRLAKLDNDTLVDTVDREFENAMSDFKAGVRTDSNNLFILKSNVLEAEHEYQSFKARHGLERMAKYPAHWFQNVAVVLLFALLDTIANAVFFSYTHPRGWAGAIFEAVFISVVNVVLGFFGGYLLLRNCNHPRLFGRVLSAFLFVALLAFLLLANTFAAHYRDAFSALGAEALTATRDAASEFALKTLREKGWSLVGFQSYLMVLIGMIVAGISMFEGFKFDDAFPGFGVSARHRQRHVGNYAAEKEMLLKGLEERKNEALSAIDYLIDEIHRRDQEFATVLESKRGLVQRYNAALGHLKSLGKQLLEAYRTANRKARSTDPPAHFAVTWEPDWTPEAVPTPPPPGERSVTTKQLAQRLGDARRTFLRAYDDAVQEYLRIDQIVTKEALDRARTEIR